MPLDRSRLATVAPLYADRTALRAVVDSVLEGRLGHADADDPDRPRVGRLSLGCYAIFGGDADCPAARRLVEEVTAPRELLHPPDPAWAALVDRVHGPASSPRPMRAFATDGLDATRLERLAILSDDGFRIRAFDVELASRLDDELIPHALQTFDSPQQFVAEGLGFAATTSDGTPVCVATSYAISSGRIELAIATRPAYRRRGLARAVAARLMLECLDRGMVPEWSAANPISQHLAVTLGYRPAGTIDITFLSESAETG